MFLEYDWTFDVYRPRFGNTFMDVRGKRSFATMAEAMQALAEAGLRLGERTDSRTWAVEHIPLLPAKGAPESHDTGAA